MSEEVVPRDVKIVHLILASMGIASYQEHVPLQLLDFAHRYSTQVFQDALVYSDYAHQTGASQPAGMGPQSSALSIDDIKLAVSARVAYQFKPTTPKDLLMTLAAERNKRALPPVSSSYGLRLPPEKHCLTGRERDVDGDDDIVIAGYEKIDVGAGSDVQHELEENENESENENEKGEDKGTEEAEEKQEGEREEGEKKEAEKEEEENEEEEKEENKMDTS